VIMQLAIAHVALKICPIFGSVYLSGPDLGQVVPESLFIALIRLRNPGRMSEKVVFMTCESRNVGSHSGCGPPDVVV
jgi:hypothetical protein